MSHRKANIPLWVSETSMREEFRLLLYQWAPLPTRRLDLFDKNYWLMRDSFQGTQQDWGRYLVQYWDNTGEFPWERGI